MTPTLSDRLRAILSDPTTTAGLPIPALARRTGVSEAAIRAAGDNLQRRGILLWLGGDRLASVQLRRDDLLRRAREGRITGEHALSRMGLTQAEVGWARRNLREWRSSHAVVWGVAGEPRPSLYRGCAGATDGVEDGREVPHA